MTSSLDQTGERLNDYMPVFDTLCNREAAFVD
jgi:hypothetical protein